MKFTETSQCSELDGSAPLAVPIRCDVQWRPSHHHHQTKRANEEKKKRPKQTLFLHGCAFTCPTNTIYRPYSHIANAMDRRSGKRCVQNWFGSCPHDRMVPTFYNWRNKRVYIHTRPCRLALCAPHKCVEVREVGSVQWVTSTRWQNTKFMYLIIICQMKNTIGIPMKTIIVPMISNFHSITHFWSLFLIRIYSATPKHGGQYNFCTERKISLGTFITRTNIYGNYWCSSCCIWFNFIMPIN